MLRPQAIWCAPALLGAGEKLLRRATCLLLVLLLLLVGCGARPTPAGSAAPAVGVRASGSAGAQPAGGLAASREEPPRRQGSTLRFDRYSIEDGLSQSSGKSILQDSRGFVWIGTEDGLNRFDGYTFTVYRHDPDDPHSLSNNHIMALYEDPAGMLWVGTYGGGLERFDPETGRFAHFRHQPNEADSLSADQVLAVHGDRSGAIWIGTRGGGLDRLVLDGEPGQGAAQWRNYRHYPNNPQSLSSDYVTSILEDTRGTLWVGTVTGLNRYEPDTDTFVRYQADAEDPHNLRSDAIRSMVQGRSGHLWVATAGGLHRLDPQTERFVRYLHDPDDPHSLGNDSVQAVYEDPSGVLWVGTPSGLDRLDLDAPAGPGANWFTHYRNDPSNPQSLSDNDVMTICGDRAGGVWIGTIGGGISRYDQLREQFRHYRSLLYDPNSLSVNGTWAIYEDAEGVLWVGTDGGGLNRFDGTTGEWQSYRNDPDNPNSLGSDVVVEVYQDRSGVFWLGTWGAGLDRFDPETEQFTHYRFDSADPQSLSNNVVWVIYQDRHGDLWIGTGLGLNRLDEEMAADPEAVQFTRYYSEVGVPHTLADNNVGSIHEDREGNLWFGTHGGLNRLGADGARDPDAIQFTRYQHDPDDPQSLSHNIIFSIHQDRSGTLWLGTWGGGLNRFDPESETFSHYRVKDGLPNDVIYGILEEEGAPQGEAGKLWLSTNYGLARFDPKRGVFQTYEARDGLQSNEFNFNSYFQSASGEMFFGGIGGFNAFLPGQMATNPYKPPVVLTALTHGGETAAAGRAIQPASEIRFAWPDNDFEFEFAVLNFYQPEKNLHAYRLDGYDQDWNYTGNRRFGGYTNLPGGTYTLRLKGANNDGLWNEEGTSLTITIVPPFWATWWFRAILALLLVVGVVGVVRLRTRRIQARSRELEEQVSSRTKELEALNTVAGVVSRSLDLNEVMCGALDRTLGVTALDAGGIYLLQEGDLLRIAAQKGLTPELVAGIDNLVVGEGFSGRVVETCEPMVVQDVAADSRLTRSVVSEQGFRSLAIAPLVSRAEVLGTLFVMSRDAVEFSPQDVDLLVAIGGQIGVAIQNARFFTAEQRRAEQFRVIAEVGRRITLTLDIEEVLEQLARLVQEKFGYYHVGVGLIEEGDVVYRVGAGRLWDDPAFQFKPSRLRVGEEGLTGWVAAKGEPLLVPDVRRDPRYVWMQDSQTRSELVVPIVVKGQVVGVLDAQSDQVNAFDETDLSVLQSLAHQAGAAIENAQLYEQAQQAAVMEERQRLARELHDAVTQTLFSASLIAEAVPATWEVDQQEGRSLLTELQQLTRGALAEMRTLLLELRPAALVEASLGDLLRQLAEAITGRMGVPITVAVDGEFFLPSEVHVALYRIAQEALNNVVKHARADQVQVSLRGSPLPFPLGVRDDPTGQGARVELCIRDDGRGFEPGEARPNQLGLGIMRERAQAIGAWLQIDSLPGRGTQVTVVWPAATQDGGSAASNKGRSIGHLA